MSDSPDLCLEWSDADGLWMTCDECGDVIVITQDTMAQWSDVGRLVDTHRRGCQ